MRLDSGGSGWSGFKLCDDGTIDWIIQNSAAARLTIMDSGEDDGVYMDQNDEDWTGFSDERAKTDIQPIENALNKLNAFQAVNFKWKYGNEKRRTRNNIGFLAQEVNEVVPEAVNVVDNEDYKVVDHPIYEGEQQAQGGWGIKKAVLIPVLVKAVQELSTANDELKARIEALEKA